jgi:hypothetical protein
MMKRRLRGWSALAEGVISRNIQLYIKALIDILLNIILLLREYTGISVQ